MLLSPTSLWIFNFHPTPHGSTKHEFIPDEVLHSDQLLDIYLVHCYHFATDRSVGNAYD